MKQNELLLVQNELVSADEKYQLDEMIEQTVEQYKNNSAQIARFTVDSITALAVVESRTDELESQSFLKRTFRNLSGKNRELKDNISYNQRTAQYAAQKTLLKLAEQNLLTFDVLTAVNSKLNAYIISNGLEINELYSLLFRFIKETRGNVLKTENRLDSLDRSVELLRWAHTVEYAIFNETPYSKLDVASQVVCLINDFYTVSKGVWDTTDLSLIKSVLKDLGKDSNQKISFSLILQKLLNDMPLMNVMEKIVSFENILEFSPLEIPMIKCLHKAKCLLIDEKYIVHTLSDNLREVGIEKSVSELTTELSLKYIREIGLRELALEQPVFELVNEFLIEVKILNSYARLNEDLMLLESKESTSQPTVAKEKELYEVIILDYEMDKFELTMLLTELLEINVWEANELLDSNKLLNRIVGGLSIEKADTINNILKEKQVYSIINLVSEPIQIVYLDLVKARNIFLSSYIYDSFSFEKHLNQDFELLDLKPGSIITPYSIIGGVRRDSGASQYESLEFLVVNLHGEVLKTFHELKDLIIDRKNESELLKPLFAIRNTTKIQEENKNNCIYSSGANYRGIFLEKIQLHELFIDTYDA